MRKHRWPAAFTLFRAIMSVGAMLRILNYVVVWLLSPNRRLDAGLKVKAYWKITLLGASTALTGCPMSFGARTTLSVYCRPVLVVTRPLGVRPSAWAKHDAAIPAI